MNRNDFEMFANNVVYFYNGATTLKPKCVKEAICKYYTEYTAQILDELAQNGVTNFTEGDIVTVSVESGPSLAQTLKNIWFKIFGKELTPVAKSTGMVTTKGN